MNRLLHAMDVFVFPSLYEGLGLTLVEAQCAGLRCVVSDAVPSEAVLSPKTIMCSLGEGAARWAELCLDETLRSGDYHEIQTYVLRRSAERLLELYGCTDAGQ